MKIALIITLVLICNSSFGQDTTHTKIYYDSAGNQYHVVDQQAAPLDSIVKSTTKQTQTPKHKSKTYTRYIGRKKKYVLQYAAD